MYGGTLSSKTATLDELDREIAKNDSLVIELIDELNEVIEHRSLIKRDRAVLAATLPGINDNGNQPRRNA